LRANPRRNMVMHTTHAGLTEVLKAQMITGRAMFTLVKLY